MSIFEKLLLGIKFFFGGFEPAADYLLALLNGWLSEADVSSNIAKYYDKAVSVYNFLVKYQKFCPVGWFGAYKETLVAVKRVIDVFSDGKVEKQEIQDCIEGFKKAYEEWLKPDDGVEAK